MQPQSTDGWALGLHSCRALSSQPHQQCTHKARTSENFLLTNHIPVFRVCSDFLGPPTKDARREITPRANSHGFCSTGGNGGNRESASSVTSVASCEAGVSPTDASQSAATGPGGHRRARAGRSAVVRAAPTTTSLRPCDWSWRTQSRSYCGAVGAAAAAASAAAWAWPRRRVRVVRVRSRAWTAA